jgi:hypothetical protein
VQPVLFGKSGGCLFGKYGIAVEQHDPCLEVLFGFELRIGIGIEGLASAGVDESL